MSSHPENLGVSVDVAASIRAKLNQGTKAIEKGAWSPLVTDEERQILSMGLERAEPVVIEPFTSESRVTYPTPKAEAAPTATVAASTAKDDIATAKYSQSHGWQVAGCLAAVLVATVAIYAWACVNRYEVIKKKINATEILYRIDHWTGAVEPVDYIVE